MRLGRILASGVLLGSALSFSVPASPASAKSVKPLVSTWAWYWEEADSRDVELPAGTVTGDTNNEFCPQVPGGGLGNAAEETCAEGRLPVRIKGGDYSKPNQTSAVIFDTLTTIPLESKVNKFTATFLEAKAGCVDSKTSPTGKECEQTDPVNVEGHELQACMVTQIFGEGSARPYKEVPDHKCSKSDPIAKRKKIKVKGEDRFEWTFNLKGFAQKWADGDVLSTGILLTGAEPKNTGPQDSWRVVLSGPLEKDGVKVQAEITPPPPLDLDPTTPPTTPGDDDTFVPGTDGTPDIPGTPGTDGTDPTTTSTDTGTGDTPTAATEPGEAKAPVDAVEEPPNEQAAADAPVGGGLPGYAWLALLAGIAGFSLLRRAVLETQSGIRPDGVLAQIQKLNAQRRGGSAAASYAPPAALAALLSVAGVARSVTKSITSKVSTVAGKLSRKKGS